MVQPGMDGTRVDQVRHGHLIDSPEPLKPGMGDDPENERILYGNESVYRIIDDLPAEHFPFLLKLNGQAVKGMKAARD
jgi:hypothetical protein